MIDFLERDGEMPRLARQAVEMVIPAVGVMLPADSLTFRWRLAVPGDAIAPCMALNLWRGVEKEGRESAPDPSRAGYYRARLT